MSPCSNAIGISKLQTKAANKIKLWWFNHWD